MVVLFDLKCFIIIFSFISSSSVTCYNIDSRSHIRWYKLNQKYTFPTQCFSTTNSKRFIQLSLSSSSSSSSPEYIDTASDPSLSAYASSSSAMPYFPLTIEEMAYDASYYIKIALMNRYTRIRIDTRMKIIEKDRHSVRWLILLAKSMLDSEITQICLFVDEVYIELCRVIIAEIKMQNIINVCGMSGKIVSSTCNDKMFIVFRPNNMICRLQEVSKIGRSQSRRIGIDDYI